MMTASIDFTPELADLVMFMSRVAISIRMHTPYRYRSGWESAKEHCKHVLWLSDSIHYFGEIARCIKANDIESAIRAVNSTIINYKEYSIAGDGWVSDPMLTFKAKPAEPVFGEFYDGWILDEGLALLERIKEKAEQ
ncbi:hypothetical protein HF670_13575 [Acidithiobacillus thiooxidans]|nr:hypothetical protein [Acidithiobacillus thiooxidans]MBU2840549.1 hypothetical protein [Acidithiobacillus thiooxidans]MDD2750685.1 hypothetical protein [Acidithiobacillus sp.]MDX5933797.1 hypothetical protein [Acidithiobacillus thiooxidans]